MISKRWIFGRTPESRGYRACRRKSINIAATSLSDTICAFANADEAYLRMGDRTKKMSFEDRITLMYDKGLRFYEDSPVADASLEDIDIDFLQEYLNKIGYGKSPVEYLLQNKSFAKEKDGQVQISAAAILLFGKNLQQFFPRAGIRFIRYDGTDEKFGTEMNVVKDVIFEGTILQQLKDTIAFIKTQIKEKTYLGPEGLFITEEEYPGFVCSEIVVNAVTHRDYSIRGTDIQIKMFDNRLVVESPGKLPGLVKPDNIRKTHFSRNPKIAEFHNDTFLLQVDIHNSDIETEKPMVETRKLDIGLIEAAARSQNSDLWSFKCEEHSYLRTVYGCGTDE